MKIKELIAKTPEMTEEKLLKIIKENKYFLGKNLLDRIFQIHHSYEADKILKEWDLINEKKSYLTKNERDKVCALVSVSLIQMTKDNGGSSANSNDGDSIKDIQEATEIRND